MNQPSSITFNTPTSEGPKLPTYIHLTHQHQLQIQVEDNDDIYVATISTGFFQEHIEYINIFRNTHQAFQFFQKIEQSDIVFENGILKFQVRVINRRQQRIIPLRKLDGHYAVKYVNGKRKISDQRIDRLQNENRKRKISDERIDRLQNENRKIKESFEERQAGIILNLFILAYHFISQQLWLNRRFQEMNKVIKDLQNRVINQALNQKNQFLGRPKQ